MNSRLFMDRNNTGPSGVAAAKARAFFMSSIIGR